MSLKNKKAIIVLDAVLPDRFLHWHYIKQELILKYLKHKNHSDDDAGLFHYLSPNGMNVYNVLGIYDKIFNLGHICNKTVLNDENGNPFASFDEDGSMNEFGANSIMIKRGILTKALREEVINKSIDLHFNKKLKDIKDLGNKVIAHFEDGTSIEGDFLIGCDGIHSRTRKIIMPDAPKPYYTKLVMAGGYAKIPSKNHKNNMIYAQLL